MQQHTAEEVRRRLGLGRIESVLRLIHSGAIRAANISSNPAGRATWRISDVDLEAFLASRVLVTQAATPRRPRVKVLPTVPQYV